MTRFLTNSLGFKRLLQLQNLSWKTWRLWQRERTKFRHIAALIIYPILLFSTYYFTNSMVVLLDRSFNITSPRTDDGLYWRFIYIFGEFTEQPTERMISPFELIGDMLRAQRKLLDKVNTKYNGTDVSAQDLVHIYGYSLFYFQQFFPLATLKTRNGPKKFIDLTTKTSKCLGINVNVNESWELEDKIAQYNPNCHFIGFGTSRESRRMVEKSKNRFFDQNVLMYDEKILTLDEWRYGKISLFNYLDHELSAITVDFLQSDDPLNGINLFRFVLANQYVLTPICQLNIPIRRNNNVKDFSRELRQLIEDVVKQGFFFLMHIEEIVPNEQWNFFVINVFFEECTQKYF